MTGMTTTAPVKLTAMDRCDRCGAQAYIKATLPELGELLFCAHHMREHGDKLKTVPGVTIQDDTEALSAHT